MSVALSYCEMSYNERTKKHQNPEQSESKPRMYATKQYNVLCNELKQRQTLIKQNKNTDIYHTTIRNQYFSNKQMIKTTKMYNPIS